MKAILLNAQNGGVFMVQNNEKVHSVAREKLVSLFDGGTFVELSAYTKRKSGEIESVCCGYGAISGKLAFAFAQDGNAAGGAFGDRQARKIASLYSLAVKNGAPVIGVFDSKGVSVYDGAEALGAYGKLMKEISGASGIVPQIAIIDGVCGGAAAVAAAMLDFVITVKDKSKFFVKAPFVTGAATDNGKAGHAAYEAENTDDALSFARELVTILPSNNADAIYSDISDDLNRAVSGNTADTETLLGEISDGGKFIRLFKGYSDNMIFGFASFGGVLSGVVASNAKTDGAIDIKSARAAAKLIGFCDSFSIPVLTLVDSIGAEVNAVTEEASYAEELAKVAFAYASTDNAKVTVVTGKAYGAAFSILGSKSVGADMVYALPEAEISVMSAEASVAFVWNDKVGEKSREELEAEWKQTVASADKAAENGEVDDVIEPSELRQRICASLSMLSAKADGAPSRKHINMPL